MQPKEVKIIPASLDVEKSILATLLIQNELMGVAVDEIRDEFFYRDSHRKLWQIFCNLYEARIDIDIATVCSSHPELVKRIGGPAFISSLLDIAVPVTNLDSHIQLLRETYARREAVIAAQDLISLGGTDEPLSEYENCLRRALAAIEGQSTVPVESVERIGWRAVEEMERLRHDDAPDRIVRTGLPCFDNMFGGIGPDDLVYIAADPGTGKSALAGTIAMNAAFRGKRVLIFSLEMSPESLVKRFLSKMAAVDGLKLNDPKRLTEAEIESLRLSQRDLDHLPIKIADSKNRSLGQIKSVIKREKERFGLDLVVIDYLQLIQQDGRFENASLQLQHISKSLYALCKEETIPLIVPSSVNRTDKGGPVSIRSLMNASVEFEADKIITGWKEEIDSTIIHWELAKHRNGPTGHFDLLFQREYTTFVSLAQEEFYG